jgi:hypothetical protein
MNANKKTKHKTATAVVDPAARPAQKLLERERRRARRALLKRRRAKSGQ